MPKMYSLYSLASMLPRSRRRRSATDFRGGTGSVCRWTWGAGFREGSADSICIEFAMPIRFWPGFAARRSRPLRFGDEFILQAALATPAARSRLILAVIFGAQWWQTRGLPEGAAPPLAGVLTDGSKRAVSRKSRRWRHGARADPGRLLGHLVPGVQGRGRQHRCRGAEHRVISVAMQSGDAATVQAFARSAASTCRAGRCRRPPCGELARARGADAFRGRWRRQHPLSRGRLRHDLGPEGAAVVGGDFPGVSDQKNFPAGGG
jgi:hypothetical protein